MSKFFTSKAFSSMNFRRLSTSSPIRVVKISSHAAMSSSFTCSSVRRSGSIVVSHKLRSRHLAQTLIPLHLVLLAALLDHILEHLRRSLLLHRVLARLARPLRRLGLRQRPRSRSIRGHALFRSSLLGLIRRLLRCRGTSLHRV